jgi:uncharacterized protein YdhG (YjbR/CyaY superfamily)
MKTDIFPTIDAYIASFAEPVHGRLSELRVLIAENAPGATERMSYAMPTWHKGENLIHLAGYAQHIGIYPGPAAIHHFAERMTEYKTSKGTLQIPHGSPLPLDLIRDMVVWRVQQAAAKNKGR